MKDNNNLQVLQNTLNRLITGAKYDAPTAELLEETESLSVHQMIAYQTAVMTYKIIQSKKPSYLASRIQPRECNMRLRGRLGSIEQQGRSLSIAKEGFIYRGRQIMNKLNEDLRCEPKLDKFKTGVKTWVKENISIKPSSKFADIGSRSRPQYQQPQDHPVINYDIRRFFRPISPIPSSMI